MKEKYSQLKLPQLKEKYKEMAKKHEKIAEHLFVKLMTLKGVYDSHLKKIIEYNTKLQNL